MKEVENILRILKETLEAVKTENASKIRELSNQTTNTASLTQDPDNIAVAVIVYSIGKILERKDYRKLKGWNLFYNTIVTFLKKTIEDIQKNQPEKFRNDFKIIQKAINKLSGKLKKYIQEVFRAAKINKASRLYAHGLSMEQTAKLLGITVYELAEYAGQTGIPEMPFSKTLSAKERIKLAVSFFEK